MEQSLSLDPAIVLRSAQGEQRFAVRAFLDTTSAEMIAERDAVESASTCVLHSVSGRWMLDATPGSRVSINGAAVTGARPLEPGDVLTVAATQFLVDEAGVTLVLRRFELAGNETLPPLADTVRILPVPADDSAVDLGEVPRIDGVAPPRRPVPRSHRGLRIAAWSAALALAALFGLFTLMQPVRLDLQPVDAQVSARGALYWHSASSVFVFPGEHRLRAEREGYIPAEVNVRVPRGRSASALIHLVKLPGKLTVDTGGVAAIVSVDGAPIGKAPGELTVPAGERTLTIRAPRYLDHVERIRIEGAGERQQLRVALKPSFGVVNVSSVPTGAQIEIDGRPQGVTPAKLELGAGIRRVQLSAPGLRMWSSSVVVSAGATSSIGPIELGAADARVTVRSVPSGAQVTTGGSFRGVTPLTIDLSPGVSHAITLTRAGYAPWSREVLAEAGKASTLDARLAALLVDVRVHGEPADAEVFVNGVSRGNAPASLSLPASRQHIEVRKAGYETFSTDLVLAPGIARTLEFKLVNPKDIVANSPPKIVTKPGVRLLLVAGGTFDAGSGRREQGRRPNEGGHKVTLQRPFYMGEREVTNEQFRRFRPEHNSGSMLNQSLDLDKQPVVRVTWDDAAEFCNWLSAQEGLTPAYQKADAGYTLITPVGTGYRLPTEAEWEFVARAVGGGPRMLLYPWGASLPLQSGVANIAGSEAAPLLGQVLGEHRDEFPATAAPALFAPNALGFYDFAGNVSEWVNDRYLSFVPSTHVTDPLGPDDGKSHTIRGSNWRTTSTAEIRFPWREGATEATDTVGFRVARYAANLQ